jgi:hypothetical protein
MWHIIHVFKALTAWPDAGCMDSRGGLTKDMMQMVQGTDVGQRQPDMAA